mmetsp:Transcript_29301/g.72473  ORF Transcript_29301/g.72473 Transcript_29301/m.72473 type:complete len:86 (-) Transcript_29301:515-772(-)
MVHGRTAGETLVAQEELIFVFSFSASGDSIGVTVANRHAAIKVRWDATPASGEGEYPLGHQTVADGVEQLVTDCEETRYCQLQIL